MTVGSLEVDEEAFERCEPGDVIHITELGVNCRITSMTSQLGEEKEKIYRVRLQRLE